MLLYSKQRLFLLFLGCSFLFWTITKLSKTYQVSIPFEIELLNVSKTIVIQNKTPQLDVNLTATGFDILRYQWFRNQLQLSAENGQSRGLYFSISLREHEFFIQEQLLENTILNGFNESSLQLAYSALDQKWVPVYIQSNLDFRPGYLLDEGLTATPDSIEVIGTKMQLDTLAFVFTEPIEKNKLTDSFTEEVNLISLDGLVYNETKVSVTGRISSYSEKQFQIPIVVKNLPLSTQIRLFPSEAQITVLARVSQLQGLTANAFELSIDYAERDVDETLALPLHLTKSPTGIKKIDWEPKQIEFLIRR